MVCVYSPNLAPQHRLLQTCAQRTFLPDYGVPGRGHGGGISIDVLHTPGGHSAGDIVREGLGSGPTQFQGAETSMPCVPSPSFHALFLPVNPAAAKHTTILILSLTSCSFCHKTVRSLTPDANNAPLTPPNSLVYPITMYV